MIPQVIRRRLRALFLRDAIEREMDEELALHLELERRERERRGAAADEARLGAHYAFGGMDHVKEAYRDARGVRSLENLMQDLRYSLRTLARTRTFTIAATLTFAIGIGATTAMVSLADTAWFGWARSYRNADDLVMVYKTFPTGAGPTSPVDFRDWLGGLQSVESLAGYVRGGVRITTAGDPVLVSSVATTANFLTVLGVQPALGRFFTHAEEVWGNHGVVVLSHGSWEKEFGADRNIVGRRITIDDAPVEIIGVAPRGTWFGPNPPSIYVPLTFAPNDTRNARHSHFVFAVGRLRAGVALASATADAQGLAARIAAEHPENAGTSIEITPLKSVVLNDVTPTLRLLIAAVLLLLAIACANVANLMLVRSAARVREMAVRSALGATLGRLTQQLLTESVLLAAIGGALGLVLAAVILQVLGGTLPANLPRVAELGVRMDWRAAGMSLLLVLASGIACGILPAIQTARVSPGSDALREGSRGVAGGKRSALARGSLVVAQVSVAMILLVLSGLLARSLVRLQQADAGVRAPERVMSVMLSLPRGRTLDSAGHVRFFDDALRNVSPLTGVVAAGVSSHLPLSGGGETKPFWIDGRMPPSSAEVPTVVGRMESAQSLSAIGASLVRGRWFEETDRGGAPRVAIIGESVARKYFGGQDPIGQRISLHPPEPYRPKEQLPPGGVWPRWTVIGIVKDVKYGSPRNEPEDAVYVHYPQGLQVWSWGPRWLVVRSAADVGVLANPVRAALRAVDATLPLGTMLPLDNRMSLSLRSPRFTAGLVTVFGIAAMLLGAIGLYGVIAYSVTQQTRAFGIRLALGATRAEVARHVLRSGLRLTALGIGIGLAGAFVATRWVEAQLFGVSRSDPTAFGAATLVLFACAVLASYLPARRAGRVDPLTALRSD